MEKNFIIVGLLLCAFFAVQQDFFIGGVMLCVGMVTLVSGLMKQSGKWLNLSIPRPYNESLLFKLGLHLCKWSFGFLGVIIGLKYFFGGGCPEYMKMNDAMNLLAKGIALLVMGTGVWLYYVRPEKGTNVLKTLDKISPLSDLGIDLAAFTYVCRNVTQADETNLIFSIITFISLSLVLAGFILGPEKKRTE